MRSWIIALPRQELLRCIEIGCFGKEKVGDRIAEVQEGDGISCYALRESKIIALGKITKGYYVDDSPKFLKEGSFSHRFDFSAELLVEREINVSTLSQALTSIPEGGNLGLLVKSGFRILTPADWNLFCAEANMLELSTPVEQSTDQNWWWVNQGRTYKQERAGGYIWAPEKGKDGQDIFHHMNVSKVRAGDIIFHYVDGKIVSVSTATADAFKAAKPQELPTEMWGQEGFMVSVNYTDLDPPIARDTISLQLRTALGSIAKSPFTKTGSVNQGYLFQIPAEFATQLVNEYPQLLPATANTAKRVDFDDEKVATEFCQAIKQLRVNTENGISKPYKPAMLLSIIDSISNRKLELNEFEFNQMVPIFIKTLKQYDTTASDKQAAAAFFHLQSEPFWKLHQKTGSLPPTAGEPAQMRERIAYASFDEKIWHMLLSEKYRERVRNTILEHWFNSKTLVSAAMKNFEYKTATSNLIKAIEKSGFKFAPWQIACYLTALRTKPFLILAGVSGSGKSQLPALIATATGGTSEIMPVRPDWTDSSDVLGYVELSGKLRPGQLLTLAKTAMDNSDKQFVCIIDEMNLARVEHYFAEILSRIEENRGQSDSRGGLIMHNLNPADRHWADVHLPKNLALIGTVNMDESSHGFSRKVLDRAFTLEFSEIDLTNWESDSPVSSLKDISERWPTSAWQPRATQLSSLKNLTATERTQTQKTVDTIVELNEMLSQAQLQLAYRSRDEIALFVLHANDIIDSFVTSGPDSIAVDPLDLAIQMKVLPRIAGGSGTIRRLVSELLGWSNNGQPFKAEEQAGPFITDWISRRKPHFIEGAKFPRTCARLCLMWERIQHEGYTSYWL